MVWHGAIHNHDDRAILKRTTIGQEPERYFEVVGSFLAEHD